MTESLKKDYLVIVNINAGRGKAKKIFNILKSQEVFLKKFSILSSSSKEEFYELLTNKKSDFKNVIVVGGDGTASLLINTINNDQINLGIFPAGSGNDFAYYTLNNRRSILYYLKKISENPEICEFNFGFIELLDSKGRRSTFNFLNNIGIGFDAVVANTAKKIPYISGLFLYLTSTFYNLVKYKSIDVKYEFNIDGQVIKEEKNIFMISIGNGKTAGGGFKLTPLADPSDGILDVSLVNSISKFEVLKVLPRAIIGAHINHKKVEYFKTSNILINSKVPFIIHADGEIVSDNAVEVRIALFNNNLKFIK